MVSHIGLALPVDHGLIGMAGTGTMAETQTNIFITWYQHCSKSGLLQNMRAYHGHDLIHMVFTCPIVFSWTSTTLSGTALPR